MDRDTVISSNVASVGYDEKSETLEIEFNNGTIYQYYNVPKPIYDEMMLSTSKGMFLNRQIKSNFPYSRVG